MTDDLQNLLAGMVKPLEFEKLADRFYRAEAPLFGNIRIECYGGDWRVAFSVPGYSDTFTEGRFPTLEAAKAAAQADYTARILAALNLDAVLALVAAAYADAIDAIREEKDSAAKNLTPDVGCYQDGFSDAIIMIERRSFRHRRATAALARMLADARAEGLEMAAIAVSPYGQRPCDCVRCDCGNIGDANAVSDWDSANRFAAAIRAMKGEQG